MSGTTLFVADFATGTIGKYNGITGEAINAKFIKFTTDIPHELALLGNTLFVAQFVTQTIGEYDATTGDVINAKFITRLAGISGLALLGNTLFVANLDSETVGEYNAITGKVINAKFINGVHPTGVAALGTRVWVVTTRGRVGKYYAGNGFPLIYNLITGLNSPDAIAVR